MGAYRPTVATAFLGALVFGLAVLLLVNAARLAAARESYAHAAAAVSRMAAAHREMTTRLERAHQTLEAVGSIPHQRSGGPALPVYDGCTVLAQPGDENAVRLAWSSASLEGEGLRVASFVTDSRGQLRLRRTERCPVADSPLASAAPGRVKLLLDAPGSLGPADRLTLVGAFRALLETGGLPELSEATAPGDRPEAARRAIGDRLLLALYAGVITLCIATLAHLLWRRSMVAPGVYEFALSRLQRRAVTKLWRILDVSRDVSGPMSASLPDGILVPNRRLRRLGLLWAVLKRMQILKPSASDQRASLVNTVELMRARSKHEI